ncbi:MAG: DsrE/DsrF/DrsH-like family protein [Actinomycetota bacterium]|nr:DsrE/DsrF/DrsH-like family protein [Actinomycetota bacterium]
MTATAEMIVPSFDDEKETDRTLAIICSKGSLDMAYPGLILGNAALGEGVDVHLFFTFWGFDIITKGRMEHLKFSPVGNPAAHMPAALAPLPGMTTMATHMMNKSLEELEIPSVPEFLELIKASGAKIWACRLSADMNHLDESDLFDGLDGIINASDFIELTEGAQLLFI